MFYLCHTEQTAASSWWKRFRQRRHWQYLCIQHRDQLLGGHQPHDHPSTQLSSDSRSWQQTDGGGRRNWPFIERQSWNCYSSVDSKVGTVCSTLFVLSSKAHSFTDWGEHNYVMFPCIFHLLLHIVGFYLHFATTIIVFCDHLLPMYSLPSSSGYCIGSFCLIQPAACKLSILNFSPKLQDKIQNRKPGFKDRKWGYCCAEWELMCLDN